jgi:hypothetical protein
LQSAATVAEHSTTLSANIDALTASSASVQQARTDLENLRRKISAIRKLDLRKVDVDAISADPIEAIEAALLRGDIDDTPVGATAAVAAPTSADAPAAALAAPASAAAPAALVAAPTAAAAPAAAVAAHTAAGASAETAETESPATLSASDPSLEANYISTPPSTTPLNTATPGAAHPAIATMDVDGNDASTEPSSAAAPPTASVLTPAAVVAVAAVAAVDPLTEAARSATLKFTQSKVASATTAITQALETHAELLSERRRLAAAAPVQIWTPKAKRLLDWHVANLEFANATTIDTLSLEHWDQDDHNEFVGPHLTVREGFSQLPRALSAGLDLRLECAATSVQYGPDGASVTCVATLLHPRAVLLCFLSDAPSRMLPLGCFLWDAHAHSGVRLDD